MIAIDGIVRNYQKAKWVNQTNVLLNSLDILYLGTCTVDTPEKSALGWSK